MSYILTWKDWAVTLVTLLVTTFLKLDKSRKVYASIPTVGGSDLPLLSWLTSINFFMNGKALLSEGYRQYKGRPFKVALIHRWLVVVSGPTMVEDVRRQPPDVMSLRLATSMLLGTEQTLGSDVANDMFINQLSLTLLTQNAEATFAEIQDELDYVFPKYIQPTNDEWLALPANEVWNKLMTGLSLRTFVGFPLCRDDEWVQLNSSFTDTVGVCKFLLDFSPGPLKSFVRNWLTPLPKMIERGCAILEPLIAEHRAKLQCPEFPIMPANILTRMITHYEQEYTEKLVEQIVIRIFLLSIVATHTNAMTVVAVVYTMAADPSYLQELREEAQDVLSKHGRTKMAMGKLMKMDSYIKEVLRVYGSGMPYTFSNGSTVPANTMIAAAVGAIHNDGQIYGQADKFDPKRFLSDFNRNHGTGSKQPSSLTSTSVDYSFGHGKHACPGRFYAANVVKAALVHLILNYDFKLEKEGVRPKGWAILSEELPDLTAIILFKRRTA